MAFSTWLLQPFYIPAAILINFSDNAFVYIDTVPILILVLALAVQDWGGKHFFTSYHLGIWWSDGMAGIS